MPLNLFDSSNVNRPSTLAPNNASFNFSPIQNNVLNPSPVNATSSFNLLDAASAMGNSIFNTSPASSSFLDLTGSQNAVATAPRRGRVGLIDFAGSAHQIAMGDLIKKENSDFVVADASKGVAAAIRQLTTDVVSGRVQIDAVAMPMWASDNLNQGAEIRAAIDQFKQSTGKPFFIAAGNDGRRNTLDTVGSTLVQSTAANTGPGEPGGLRIDAPSTSAASTIAAAREAAKIGAAATTQTGTNNTPGVAPRTTAATTGANNSLTQLLSSFMSTGGGNNPQQMVIMLMVMVLMMGLQSRTGTR